MDSDGSFPSTGLGKRASTVQAPAQAPLELPPWRRHTTGPVATDDSPVEKRLKGLERFEHEPGDLLKIPEAPRGRERDSRGELGYQPASEAGSADVALAKETEHRSPVVNFLLCLVNLCMGLLTPTMVDMSRTAMQYQPGGIEGARCLPYSTASVVMAEALVNVVIGYAAIRNKQDSLRKLRDWKSHKEFLWLTVTYCLGDVVALCAIGRGGGLLFITMNNSRLLFAAAASHYMLVSRPLSEWSILFAIFLSLICFAAGTTSGQEAELRIGTVYASGLAMLKAGLSALAAVMTERRLKLCQFTMMEANTLLKMQSLMVALVVFVAQMRLVEDLCPEDKALVTTPCVNRRGWDSYTAFVLFAEVGNGWLSVVILARMSAIVKFVCKAAAAPSLYVVYVVTNFRQHHFEWATFVPILIMTGLIYLYAEPRCCCEKQNQWTIHYSRP
ncbi:unnamed protein product [Symbiodinium sp. CCMP2592]|nr:unnamed protein product [Symbiodinium sp. CCMP2592]